MKPNKTREALKQLINEISDHDYYTYEEFSGTVIRKPFGIDDCPMCGEPDKPNKHLPECSLERARKVLSEEEE